MKWNKLVWITIILFGFIHCNSDDDAQDFACTSEFVILTVNVEHQNGEPVIFDSVAVNRKSDNFLFEFPIEIGFKPGNYILMTDRFLDDLDENGTELLFAGFGDPNELILVASYEFTVKKGVCHVEKVSGPNTIVLK